jgi:hypothetical protein
VLREYGLVFLSVSTKYFVPLFRRPGRSALTHVAELHLLLAGMAVADRPLHGEHRSLALQGDEIDRDPSVFDAALAIGAAETGTAKDASFDRTAALRMGPSSGWIVDRRPI